MSSGGKCSATDCGVRDPREMNLRVDGGVTSWWSTQPVLYPFGFGLSYTTFSYKWSNLPPVVAVDTATLAAAFDYGATIAGETTASLPAELYHTVEVTNTGTITGDCVVLAFVTATDDSNDDTPIKKLFGFERLAALKPGESRTVSFASGPAELANADKDGAVVLGAGSYGVEVGDVVAPAKRTVVLTGAERVVLRPPQVPELKLFR